MGGIHKLQVEEADAGAAKVLRLVGEADMLAVPDLKKRFKGLRSSAPALVVVDLASTTFINTAIWALLATFNRDMKAKTKTVVAGMSENVRASYDIIRLEGEIPAYDTAEAAIAAG